MSVREAKLIATLVLGLASAYSAAKKLGWL